MSKSGIYVAIDRISTADPESPIAVFIEKANKGIDITSRFANTPKTQWEIRNKMYNYIGTFSSVDNLTDVRILLSQALKKAKEC